MSSQEKVGPALKTIYSKAQEAFYREMEEGRAAVPDKRSSERLRQHGAEMVGRGVSRKLQEKPRKKQGIPRLLEIAEKRRGLLVISCVLALIGAVGRMAPFVTVYLMVVEVVANWDALPAVDWSYLGALTILTFAAAAVQGIALYLSTMCAHTAAFNILYEVRIQLMAKLARVPSGFFSQTRQGEVKKVMNADVEQIEGFVAHSLPDAVSAVAAPLFTTVFLFTVDWRFSIAVLAPIVLAFFFTGRALKTPEGAACQAAMRESREKVEGTIVEYVHGMNVVKVFNRSLSAFKRFESDTQEYVDNVCWATHYNMAGMAAMLTALGTQVLFLMLAALLILPSVRDYPAFVSTVLLFFLVGSAMKEPVFQMIQKILQVNVINAAVDRIDEIVGYPEVVVADHPVQPDAADVEFCHVDFSYGGEAKAIKDVSFILQAGSITGLVGPSGGGKSTIANMVLRFFDADSGEIRIGGVDVRDVDPEELTNLVSYVFQDSILLGDTIENNIRMGNKTATVGQVVEAAQAANIHEVIENLPQGYDTTIGPGGTYLSGGEAQRLAIARVFLKDTPIVVLDEATAYADAENETKIQQAFARLAQDKTVLIIAHRLKTVEAADRILVMNEGCLAGEGTHEQLLANNAVYQGMVKANERRDSWEITVDENGGW